MSFQCVTLGDSLTQNGSGELEVNLATDSGLEILPSGLNIVDEQRAPNVLSYTPTFRIGGTTSANDMSSLGSGTLQGWYQQVGGIMHFSVYFRIDTGTVFGHTGIFFIGVPATPHASAAINVGNYMVYDYSAVSIGHGFVRFDSTFVPPTFTSEPQLVLVTSTDAAMTTTSGAPVLGGQYDFLYIQGSYRVA